MSSNDRNPTRPFIYEVIDRLNETRRAEQAEIDRWGGIFGCYATVRATTLALMRGAVLHVQTEAGALTAGNGQLIDWRTVRSGEVVVEGPEAVLAIGLVRRVQSAAVMAAVEDLT
jgi:hypothetical protein